MKVLEVIRILADMEREKTNPFEKTAYKNLIKKIRNYHGLDEELEREDIAKMPLTEHMKTKLLILIGRKGDEYIPRQIIEKFKTRLLEVERGQFTKLIVAGSYRRKAKFSNDVDIVVLEPTKKFWSILESSFELKKISDGEKLKKYVLKIKTKNVKVDFFICHDPNTFIAMTLFSTGSSALNIKMRMLAKRKNLKLNQLGLFKGDKRLNLRTEKDFFDALGMKYLEPEQR